MTNWNFDEARLETLNVQTLSAKILDATHLELLQPIVAPPGDIVQVAIRDEEDDERLWLEAGKRHMLGAYADEDAIYDDL